MTIAADLRELVAVNDGESALDQHGADLSYHAPARPDVVVYPESTEEVARVLAYAHEQRVPVVPFGAGTSLEGHVIPLHGGISLDLTRLNRIVAVRPQDLTVTVQAGVTRLQLESELGPRGLWFPVDPGADATLGGMAATNASGTTTVRYGGMRAHVLEVEVVLPGGKVIRAGSRAVKTSAGYHLSGLFIGSEGTLGVVTELTLRIHPIPERSVVARAAFPSIEAACEAAAALIAAGVQLTRCELLDAMTVAALNAFADADLPISPYLFLEVGGTEAAVAGDVETVRELVTEAGATEFSSFADPTERARMWGMRHKVLMASLALAPGSRSMTTDVAVPVSELPAAIAAARQALDAAEDLRGGIVGHVGDGNFHVAFLLDPNDAGAVAQAKALNDDIVRDALARGGTCTGEHGVGFGKIGYLAQEHADLVPFYAGIKHLFDPHGIMNPGKVVEPLP